MNELDIRSKSFRRLLYAIDDMFLKKDQEIANLKEDRDHYRKQYGETLNRSIKHGNKMMANVLSLVLGENKQD